MNIPPINLDEGSAGPQLYIIRSEGTSGVTRALRRKIGSDENMVCLYLFTSPLGAFEYLTFMGLDPDQWELAGSEEFGGVAALLNEAMSISTHMVIDPPMEHGALVKTPPIEYAIEYFESLPAEESNSGAPSTPFWLLCDNAQQHVYAISIPGGKAVCLFKTEMDAEEFRHSGWVPADEWMSDGPIDPARGVLSLEEYSSLGLSHAVINPPPGSTGSLKVAPIEELINHIEEKGHIRNLD